MGVIDAPAWVLAAWQRSLRDVGASADRDTVAAYGQRMIERWSAPERTHHNLKRLIAVLARVDELAPETHDPNMVRLAAWYHGAVFNAAAQHAYAHRGGIDEEASAQLARSELTELGVPENVVGRIATMIQGSTRHAASKNDIDAQALCDADLGGLAVDPQRYAAYRKEVRQEYAHIPQSDYVRARLAIVTKLLNRPYLFQSPMAQPWEDPARENLTAELDRLTAEAAKLPAVEAGATEAAAERLCSESGAESSGADSSTGPGEDRGIGATSAEDVTDPDREAPQDRAHYDATEPPGRDHAQVGARSRATPSENPRGSEPAPARPADASRPDLPRDEARGAAPRRPGGSAASPARDEPSQQPEGRKETLAERSQRLWEARNSGRSGWEDESVRRARRRGVSAASPADAGAETPARARSGEESGEDEAEEIDKTSSLSRPPKMPAIKRRPRDQE